MMNKKNAYAALFTLLLTSCDQTAMLSQQYQKNNNRLGAEVIDPDLGGKCSPNLGGTEYACSKNTFPIANAEQDKTVYDRKTYIALLIGDSQKKCDDFTRYLALSENNMANPGLSNAISTALPQMNALNAVANASGISGNSTAESDNYARKNIANYIQAIHVNYGNTIQHYLNDIEAKDENKINVAIEISNIRLIHGLCSLNAAQGFIAERLGDSRNHEIVPAIIKQ